MATATPNEADEIRRKMALIRRDLHADVREVVKTAEAATDWRHYIKIYPWASVAGALTIGYLLAPRRRRKSTIVVASPDVAAALAPSGPLVTRVEEKKEKRKSGLMGAAFGLLGPIAMRAAQNYATHFLTSWVARQQETHLAAMMGAGGFGDQGSPSGSMSSAGPSQTQGGVGLGGFPR